MFPNIKVKKKSEDSQVSRNDEHLTLLLCKTIKMNGHSVVFGQLVQKLDEIMFTNQFYST